MRRTMAFPLVHVARSGECYGWKITTDREQQMCMRWLTLFTPDFIFVSYPFVIICRFFLSGGMELFEAMEWIGGTDVLWTFWWWFEGDYSGWWSKIRRSLMYVVAVCESKHQVLFLNGSGVSSGFLSLSFVEISHGWEDFSRVHTIGIFGAFFFRGKGRALPVWGEHLVFYLNLYFGDKLIRREICC